MKADSGVSDEIYLENPLTHHIFYAIVIGRCNSLFFMPKIRVTKFNGGDKVVRVKITLACTECKQRNYDTTKEKRNHPDRMETKKYCRFCRRHTLHKETK